MIRGVAALALCGALSAAPAAAADAGPPPDTEVVRFADLPGVEDDDLRAALHAFLASCAAVDGQVRPSRAAVAAPPALRDACRSARALPRPATTATARRFFAERFEPRRVAAPGFFTGYYEPVVEASLTRTGAFATPLLALPDGFVPGAPASRRLPGGGTAPLPDRAGIEAGAPLARPLAYVREPVDAFFVQVQGSARLALPDGSTRRLAFAGRNGYPYTAIGKLLVDELHIPPADMGMSQLKDWIRAHGQGEGDAGTALMRRNRSYIFFRFDDARPAGAGPVGAAGVALTAGRSLAVDRGAWPYGLPMFVDAELPGGGGRFDRLMVAQDTGSAIVGPARGDIFFGTGPTAAASAGPMRGAGTLFVLWPRAAAARPGGAAR